MEQIPGITEMVLAVCSGRAADGHHDTCVKEPKLMNMGLFLSPSTALLIKKPIQLITFCHFSYMSMNKLANRCVKNITYIGNCCCFCFTCCGHDRDVRNSECRKTFRGNSHPIIAQLSCYSIYFDLTASWLCREPVAAECTSGGAGLAFN